MQKACFYSGRLPLNKREELWKIQSVDELYDTLNRL